MNARQRQKAIDACNHIIAANARLQIIAADIQRGCDEMRSLCPEKPQERFTVGEQPCDKFLRGDADVSSLGPSNRRNLHQCTRCCGNRAWCDNCHSDHHDGGWETCKLGAYDYVEE